jgi:hypothetical protein
MPHFEIRLKRNRKTVGIDSDFKADQQGAQMFRPMSKSISKPSKSLLLKSFILASLGIIAVFYQNCGVQNIAFERMAMYTSLGENTTASNTDQIKFDGPCDAIGEIQIREISGSTPAGTSTEANSAAANNSANSTNSGSSPTNLPATVCTNGLFTFQTPTRTIDGRYSFELAYLNQNRVNTTVVYTWIRDTTGPIITVTRALPQSRSGVNGNSSAGENVALAVNTYTKNNIRIQISAQDTVSPITHICIVPSSRSAPTSSNKCFRSLSALNIAPNQSLNQIEVPYLVGFTPGHFSFSIYLMDSLNNISTLDTSKNLGIDYDPGTAPIVKNVIVTNSINPTSPPSLPDLQFSDGGQVYIKWHASDDKPLPRTPIEITYTTDDINFNLIATNASNAITASCVDNLLNTNYTGCITWTLPSSLAHQYFRIRVAAKDDNGLLTFSSSPALNLEKFRTIAGNTDIGTNASASSGILKIRQDPALYADPQSLVVTSDGTIFFKDFERGIMRISPDDGLFKILIKKTGTMSGDGGTTDQATVCNPQKIALDYKERLLIYDCKAIRRVDFSRDPNGQIDTLIGGGTKSNSEMIARDMLLGNSSYTAYYGGMHPLPNGDIIFLDQNLISACNHVATPDPCPATPRYFWRYSGSDGIVRRTEISGTGLSNGATLTTDDVSKYHIHALGFSFDPSNSKILITLARMAKLNVSGNSYYSAVILPSGVIDRANVINSPFQTDFTEYIFPARSGELFTMSRNFQAGLYRYDEAAKNWFLILGKADKTKSRGYCIDGTLAADCAVDLSDAFVTDQNIVYFVDNGLIRVIDEQGKVKTLFGQPLHSGDDGQATSGRFNLISYIGEGPGGAIVIQDWGSNRYREIKDGIVSLIAGSGSNALPAVGSTALTGAAGSSYWGGTTGMMVDKTTGDIFATGLIKLNRTTGLWERFVGGATTGAGATDWLLADGVLGKNIKSTWNYNLVIHGASPTHIFATSHRWNNMDHERDNMAKLYARADGTQKHFAGVARKIEGRVLPADGTVMASNDEFGLFDTMGSAEYLNGSWYWFNINTKRIAEIPEEAGNEKDGNKINGAGAIKTFYTTINPVSSFAIAELPETNVSGAKKKILFYCSTAGSLYQVANQFDPISKAEKMTETKLKIGTDSIKCNGRKLIYNQNLKLLYFPFIQNGLHAVGEYTL